MVIQYSFVMYIYISLLQENEFLIVYFNIKKSHKFNIEEIKKIKYIFQSLFKI